MSFSFIALSTLLSWVYRPRPATMLEGRTVGVVVPMFNEDPAAVIRGLESLLDQTRPPDRIYVVDDCSATSEAHDAVSEWASGLELDRQAILLFRLPENGGKREAQAVAFRDWRPDIWVTVDSDTYFAPNALSHLLAPFNDPEVLASTGRVQSWNWNASVLNQIVDLEMGSTAVTSRSTASVFRSVLVSTGAIAAYRGDFVSNVLEEYLNETFRGRPVRSGDDRRLTMLALLYGKTEYADQAVALSLMPENVKHFVKQRIRWSASWYRGTLWGVRNLPVGPALWLLVVGATRALLNLLTLPATIWLFWVYGAELIVPWIAAITAIYLLRGLRLVPCRRPDQTLWRTVASLWWIPAVAFLQVVLLSILHWVAAFWMFDQKWGTRSKVEVTAT